MEQLACTDVPALLHNGAIESVSVVRVDAVTPYAMGNKFFKLRNTLLRCQQSGVRRILSFGGAWSNHLLALSQLASELDIHTVGIVRGEAVNAQGLAARTREFGMRLHFVSRQTYRRRHEAAFCEALKREFAADVVLPEGGSSFSAVEGSAELASLFGSMRSFETLPDTIALAVGTGATFAGLAAVAREEQQIIGFDVVGDASTGRRVDRWLRRFPGRAQLDSANIHLLPVSCGRYARARNEVLQFILSLHAQTGMALDPVYTGPALFEICRSTELSLNGPIAFVHTGGLAGAAGFDRRFQQVGSTADVKSYFETVNNSIKRT